MKFIGINFLILSMLSSAFGQTLISNEKYALVIVNVKDNEGLAQGNKDLKLIATDDSTTYLIQTNSKGGGSILLPVGKEYSAMLGCEKNVFKIGPEGYQTVTRKFICTDLPTTNHHKILDEWPDTVIVTPGVSDLKPTMDLVLVKFLLDDFNGKPLANELIKLEGQSSRKIIFATTGLDGRIELLIPKGDKYNLSFHYDPNFDVLDYPIDNSLATTHIEFEYEGTVAIELRLKEEAERLELERKRLEKERLAYETYLRESRLTTLEAIKDYIKNSGKDVAPNFIQSVFERNQQWINKLIICDVTGSMNPYTRQLIIWYSLQYQQEKNSQFVFFNDGDDKEDDLKKLGETGGVYYGKDMDYEQLFNMMANVMQLGSGGGTPENNIEAILTGISRSSSFTDLIMIADSHAPVSDISLLSQIKVPVRIILCGGEDYIHADYLKIAYHTKGSIHTMEQDIVNLSQYSDGETIRIGNQLFKLSKGKFIEIIKT